jgi:hypothetical protein
MSDYELADGHDSEPSSDSGSEQESPTQEEDVDYTPLEQMQGSRRKEPNGLLEVHRGLRAPRVVAAVQN